MYETPVRIDCGAAPCKVGGSTHCYSHQYHYHRARWLEFKKENGTLSDGVDEARVLIKEQSNAAAVASGASITIEKFKGPAKAAMDRATSEWICDDDQARNAACTPKYQEMTRTATSGAHEGCGGNTVGANLSNMAEEDVEICAKLHGHRIADGIKPVASSDLWSKNGLTLFGLLTAADELTAEVIAANRESTALSEAGVIYKDWWG